MKIFRCQLVRIEIDSSFCSSTSVPHSLYVMQAWITGYQSKHGLRPASDWIGCKGSQARWHRCDYFFRFFFSKLSLFDAQVWWLPLWPVESLALLDHKPGCSSCRRPQVSKKPLQTGETGQFEKVIVKMQGGADSNAGLHRALLWLQGVCKVN